MTITYPYALLLVVAGCTTVGPAPPAPDVTGAAILGVGADFEEGSLLRLENEDGTAWWEGDPFGSEPGLPPGFAPLLFDADDRVLSLRVREATGSRLLVVVDERHGLTRYVRRPTPGLAVRTWEAFVREDVGALEGGAAPQLLRASPSEAAPSHGALRGVVVPRAVRGDWIEVCPHPYLAAASPCGWVRWQDDEGRLLLTVLLND